MIRRRYSRKRTYRRKPSRRPTRRRYGVKKRTYRKKTSRRSILNLTSRKKRDTMMCRSNITAASQQAGTTYFTSPAIITGGISVQNPIVWCATARDNTFNTANTSGTVFDQSTRTSTTCYMVGLSEKVEIQISDGVPWQWRRIVFTYKGFQNAAPDITGFSLIADTSAGYARQVNALPNNTYRDTVEGLVFRGAKFTDWFDAMTAFTDPTRITVLYDKTRTIASGNEDGCIRKYSFYQSFGKNLVYGDDEAGGTENVQYYSTQSRAGMGDVIVMDYFLPRMGTTSANQLSFNPTATLYWHEK